MTRILMRAGKDPFTPVAPETTLTQDVFNSNSGNFLFQHSVWKALSVPGTEIVPNGTLSERVMPQPGDAERINEQFDHFVIPLANAFRPEFAHRLVNLAALLRDVTIPVTVVGVGAQAGARMSLDELGKITDVVKTFVGLVLDHSATIGVRGEFTREYLLSLGFPDSSIDVIGCPSLFLHGPDLQVHQASAGIRVDSPLALNLTPEVPGIGAFATAQAERHPNLLYVGQDQHDLRLLLWGVPFPHVHDPLVPVHLHHPLYQQDRMRLFVDTWTWYDFMATQDFAYGTRFHGNVAALLAGTPAMLLAHDSRTLELAQYHGMPYQLSPSLTGQERAEDLYEATDLTTFNASVPELFGRYTAFLERNGLTHAWQQPGPGPDPAFAERLAAAKLPGAVTTLANPDVSEIASRLQWLRDGTPIDITRHKQAYTQPFPHPPWNGSGTRPHRLEVEHRQRLAEQDKKIKALSARLEHVERQSARGVLRRVRNRLRRVLGRSRREP